MHAWEEPNLKWIRSWLFNALGLVCSCCTGIPSYVIMDFRSEPLPGFTCHWINRRMLMFTVMSEIFFVLRLREVGLCRSKATTCRPFCCNTGAAQCRFSDTAFYPLTEFMLVHSQSWTETLHSHTSLRKPILPALSLFTWSQSTLWSGSYLWEQTQFFFLPFLHILPVYLNPSRQVVPSSPYSDTQTHLGC